VLVTPAGHALAGQPVIDAARLQDETWIDFGPGTDLLATIELLVERRRLRRHVAARVSQMSMIIDLVRAGLGIAIVPRPVAAGSGLPMVRLGDADTTRTLALARVGGPPSSSAVDVVMRELLGAESRIA
jgi:DNA-binding transcriptional LysR family regulator